MPLPGVRYARQQSESHLGLVLAIEYQQVTGKFLGSLRAQTADPTFLGIDDQARSWSDTWEKQLAQRIEAINLEQSIAC
jgi:hypothetical protein